MNDSLPSRRSFLKVAALSTAGVLLEHTEALSQTHATDSESPDSTHPDYTIRIRVSPIEIAPNHIISVTNYNGQFPGPLVRLKEGQPVTVDILNETEVPEQLHWHGQMLPVDVDGAAEEGTPFIPARGKRRIRFIPRPAGFRFYHTHNRAGANLYAGQYNGEVGPVTSRPKASPATMIARYFLC